MSNPRFADIEMMLEERNFEAAGIALGQVITEMHNDDIDVADVEEFVNAVSGELA